MTDKLETQLAALRAKQDTFAEAAAAGDGTAKAQFDVLADEIAKVESAIALREKAAQARTKRISAEQTAKHKAAYEVSKKTVQALATQRYEASRKIESAIKQFAAGFEQLQATSEQLIALCGTAQIDIGQIEFLSALHLKSIVSAELFRQSGRSPLEDESRALPGAAYDNFDFAFNRQATPLLSARIRRGNEIVDGLFEQVKPEAFPLAAKDLRPEDKPRKLAPVPEPVAADPSQTQVVGGVTIGAPRSKAGMVLAASSDKGQ